MPDIITCFKWVIDEAYIKVGSSGEIDLNWVDYKLSDYDKNALEAAVHLVEQYGGSTMGVTVGTPDDTKGVKDALARGMDKAVFINDPAFMSLEPAQTASILAEVISTRLKYDLIICGEGSSDLYTQQVGQRLAERLGIPGISYVTGIKLENDRIVAERKGENSIEVLTVPFPALVTVSPQINTPRIPGLKDTLAASKKPVIEVKGEDLSGSYAPNLETIRLKSAAMGRKCVRLSSQADIVKLVDSLMQQGILP